MEDKYYLRVGKATDLENRRERVFFRVFEMLPGTISWLTLVLFVFLSWKLPLAVAFFIITFDIYWLIRTVYFSFHLRAGYRKMRQHEKIDWLEKLKKIPDYEKIYHLVIFTMYKEPLEIVRESIRSLEKTDYPKDKMIVILATEERGGDKDAVTASRIEEEFRGKFFRFSVTVHPKNLPGEIAGKGSNDAWALRFAKEKIIDALSISYENVVCSFMDGDTVLFPKYFSCLTYYYLTAAKPERSSYQPIPLFINNVWEAPVISRIFGFSSTFWHTMNQERPDRLITFSSHSMSFKALVDVGFKLTNVVSDDSRIFWQCFFRYDGDYRVVPIFYPVAMDATVSGTLWNTLKNLYKQQRRWAYGMGEIPYFALGVLKNKKIPWRKKISLGSEIFESHWSWATAPILIFMLGWLPLVLGGDAFNHTLMAYNLPRFTSQILTFAMFGIIASMYFSFLLLPPRPAGCGRWRLVVYTLQWVIVPLITIFFSALPALDAQTRWLFGKYMGFWITEKVRKNR